MGVARDQLSTHTHWCCSNTDKKCTSPWLQSTLAELDDKTEAILSVIQQDADTFAQRADMYFNKRPQLLIMVDQIYRSYRLLAEGYDQIKCRRILASPLPFTKYPFISSIEKSYDTYSESFHPDSEYSFDLSEIEDPDNDQEESQASNGLSLKTDQVLKLHQEIERLKEKTRVQQQLLMQKDEEKREAIRQLCTALDLLREENSRLRMKASPKRENFIELKASKKGFLKRLFSTSPKH